MTGRVIPAPPWRRLAAAVYDGLLLLALWMVAALLDVVVRDQWLGLPREVRWLQAYFFVVGLAFFGGFWVRGGQTLGMRAWRLRVRRDDGSALRWPTAVLRYAAMLTGWGVTLTPALLKIPHFAAMDPTATASLLCLALLAAGIGLALLDPRRRCPWDWVSGTEVVLVPKA